MIFLNIFKNQSISFCETVHKDNYFVSVGSFMGHRSFAEARLHGYFRSYNKTSHYYLSSSS